MTSKVNYYQALNLEADATATDIIQAYRETKLIFEADSLATYSLYDEATLKQMNVDVEEAYDTLSNSDKRQAYNKDMGFAEVESGLGCRTHAAEPVVEQKSEPSDFVSPMLPDHPRKKMPLPEIVNGSALKSIRKLQGVTIKQIADKTKISIAYLKAIEADDTTIFPSEFYLKSYFKQYVELIGIDADAAWGKYKRATTH